MHPSARTLVAPALAAAPVDNTAPVEGTRGRALAAVACGALVALPFLFVRFPPITDLPQHAAQIRLFLSALGDPDGAYRIQWFTPYSAVYTLLGAVWAMSTPANAGRLAVLALGVLSTLAVHALAARRHRPIAAAVLASALFFNHTVYWGFLSFAAGWVAFVVWVLVTTQNPADEFSWRTALLQLGAAVVLYASHALWFAFGLAWAVLYLIVHRVPVRAALWRLASVAPVAVAAALWYPHLAALGFVSPTMWFTSPPARLEPEWLVDAALGGLQGPTEYLLVGLLLAWVAGGLWQHRDALRAAGDSDLLWTGGLLVGLGLLLPDQYMNTIQFAARWVPAGVILLLLGAPPPVLLGSLQRPLALAVLAVFSLATTLAWMRFERDDLSGLSAALDALPDGQRVVGLDLIQESAIVKGRPFIQTFAYAQVLHGGRLNASFAGFAPSLVVFRQPHPAPWTTSLEWYADRVRAEDFAYFDYALINGRADVHERTRLFPLTAVTTEGRWRLYRVTAPQP